MAGEDVMPLPPDIRAQAQALADDLELVGKSVAHTQVASSPSTSVPGWVGESFDAYTGEIQRLGTHARGLSGCFAAPAQALRDWAEETGVSIQTEVPGLWAQYDAAQNACQGQLEAFESEIARARDGGHPFDHWSIQNERTRIRAARDDAQTAILEEYRREMDRLDEAAAAASVVVRGVLDQVVDPAVAGHGRAAVAATLFDDMPLVDGQATWEYAQRMAPEIAGAMRDEDLTAEELGDFRDSYGDLLENPFYANALMERMTPDEVMAFTLRVSGMTWSAGEGVAGDVLRSVGTTLVLSTGGTNLAQDNIDAQTSFEIARRGVLAADGSTLDDLSARRMEELKSAGRTIYDPSRFIPDSLVTEVAGYELITQVMGAAAGDNPDLALGAAYFTDPPGGVSVARDIVAWDNEVRTYQGLHGYSDGPLFLGTDQSIRDPLHTMYVLMDRPDSLDLDTADQSLVAADRTRLDSVQHFLTSDTPFDVDSNWDGEIKKDEGPMDMTRYLTGFRQSGGFAGEYHGFQDGGEAFGEAIQQASYEGEYPPPQPTDHASRGDYERALADWEAGKEAFSTRDSAATQIAGSFLLGYQDGLDADFNIRWVGSSDTIDGQDVFGHSNPALRSWAGVVLAPHVESITNSLPGHYSSFAVVGTGPDGHQFHFSQETANRILGRNGVLVDLGFDRPEIDGKGTEDPSDDTYVGRAPAVDNLLIAAKQGYEADMRNALGTGVTSDLDRATDRWAPIIEASHTAPEEASVEALRALDARNERWQGLITAGVGAIPFGEVVSDPVGKWAIDQAKSHALTPTLEAMLSTDRAADGEVKLVGKIEMAERYMADAMYSVLSTDGRFLPGPDSPEAYCEGLDSVSSFVTPLGDVIAYDTMTSEQRAQFEHYLLQEKNGTGYASSVLRTGEALNQSLLERGEARTLGSRDDEG